MELILTNHEKSVCTIIRCGVEWVCWSSCLGRCRSAQVVMVTELYPQHIGWGFEGRRGAKSKGEKGHVMFYRFRWRKQRERFPGEETGEATKTAEQGRKDTADLDCVWALLAVLHICNHYFYLLFEENKGVLLSTLTKTPKSNSSELSNIWLKYIK